MFQWLHRHKFVTFVLTMFLAGMAGLGSIWVKGQTIEDWIGLQIKEVANYYLEPHLDFKRLTYKAPRTVLLDDLTLTAKDPDNGNAPIQIVSARRATVQLAEIPRLHRPIKIEHIELDNPSVRLISRGEPRKMIGFSSMLKKKAPPQPGVAGPPKMKPSNIFQMKSVVIRDGLLHFEPRRPNHKPMSLDHINGELNIARAETGGYRLALQASRLPVFAATLDGMLDMDTSTLELAPFVMKVALTPETSHVLPPQLSAFLDRYGVTGQLELRTTGTLPLRDKSRLHLRSAAGIEKGTFNVKHYQIAVDRFGGFFETTAKGLLVMRADAAVLGGTLTVSGEVPFDRSKRVDFDVRAQNLRLERVIDTFSPMKTSPFRGDLSGEFAINFPRENWQEGLQGGGKLWLRNAYLKRLPVLGPVVALIAKPGQDINRAADYANATFVLHGETVHVKQLTAHTPDMALRGGGSVSLKGQLDMRVNAGPLERIESAMGPIGEGLGQFTDALANYRVTGKISDPDVSLQLGPR